VTSGSNCGTAISPVKNERINAFVNRVVRALGFTGMGEAKPVRDNLFKSLRAGAPVDWGEILRRAPNPIGEAEVRALLHGTRLTDAEIDQLLTGYRPTGYRPAPHI
jgi:hypothetical protein